MSTTHELYRCSNRGAIMSGVKGKCPKCGSFLWLDTRTREKEPTIFEKILGGVLVIFVVVAVVVFAVSALYKIFGPDPPPQDPHWTKMPDLSKVGPEKIDVLFKSLRRYGEGSRCNAAFYLGKLKDRRAVKPLIDALNKDESYKVRASAAAALAEHNEPRVIEALIKVINDTSIIKTRFGTTQVRSAAVKALGKIDNTREYTAIHAALYDPEISIRTEAIQVIGQYAARKINRDDQREILIGFLKDKDRQIRSTVARVLGETADSLAVEPLINSLRDPDERVRREAAEALGKLKDRRAVLPLIALLGASVLWVQIDAVRALGEIGDRRAIGPLKELQNKKPTYEDLRNEAKNVIQRFYKQ